EKAAAAFALGTDLVELRLDLLQRPTAVVPEGLADLARRSVITVRRKEEGGGCRGEEAKRLALISELAELRPLYIDVELSTAEESPDWFRGLPKTSLKIVSWHDFAETPALSIMKRARDKAGSMGDVAKIVTNAKS